MGIMQRAFRFLKVFPGFWLNVIALLIAGFIVFGDFREAMRDCDTKCSTATERLNRALSDYLAKSRSRFAVADQIRQDLHVLSHLKPEDGLRNHPIEPHVDEFLASLNIPVILARVTPPTKEIEISRLEGRFRKFLHDQSTLGHNLDVYIIWAGVAVLYVVLVGLAYFAKAANPEEAERLLNIVDIGLLLTLIEYSGGLQSPVLLLLFISIAVAGFELVAAIRKHPLTWSRFKVFGIPTVLAAYVPSFLYLFALLTGLAWASIDNARGHDQSLGRYFLEYAVTVTTLFLYALLTFTALSLFYRLLRHRTA